MLSPEDNLRMCSVGPATPGGRALRRYWMPAMLSAEIAEPGGDPKGVELLGERFVAFRDAQGQLGFYDEACLHRGASMLLARAEGDGLRCIYHGWKFAADGRVLDTPNVADLAFAARLRGRNHPVHEAGGFVWVYLGPPELQPPFHDWPWLRLPEAHRIATTHVEECNYVQVMEGLLDSSHLGLLHMDGLQRSGASALAFAQKVNSMQFDLAPRLEVEETDFGLHYAALREIQGEQGPRTEARVAAFQAPCFIFNPNGDVMTIPVPASDTKTIFFHAFWDPEKRLNEEPLRSEHLRFIGLDDASLDACGLTEAALRRGHRPTRENRWFQDRAGMRRGERFSGLSGIIEDDVAVSLASGPVRDRSQELLSSADAAVARMYRVLLRSVKQVEAGGAPVGLDTPVDTARIAGAHGRLPPGGDWRSLVPSHRPLHPRDAGILSTQQPG